MPLDTRAYLLHFTHYDPAWVANKANEIPFDLAVAKRVVDRLHDEGFTTLVIDIKDGVVFDGHPELVRHYSRPMSELSAIAAYARERGLDIIPKLNMSRSPINCHNHWMRADGEIWHEHFDDAYWWALYSDILDQCLAACQPQRFVHIGMDEDHERSHAQFAACINRAHALLAERGLRTIIWSDAAIDYATGEHYVEKARYAETRIPTDVVQILWHYRLVPTTDIERIRAQGFELWCAAGSTNPDQCRGFLEALVNAGGTGAVMTTWKGCHAANEAAFLDQISAYAPYYRA